jgi:glucose-1-phosphate adenylyltransferase
MFINAMGLILADNKKIHLGELSRPRALAAMPFAGRYRIIDFMLSTWSIPASPMSESRR